MRMLPLSVVCWLGAIGLATGQEPPRSPLTRADAHVVIGWQNLHKEQPAEQNYNNWVNGIFYGGGGAGWYWTDHLKTQVDVGGGTRGRQYRSGYSISAGQTISSSSQLSIREQSVAVGQHYQFFRNQWFHPHLGAGVDIARETTTELFSPVVVFDSAARITREIRPGRAEGPTRRTIARPFAEAGLKAYMTRRAFFTADTRLMYRHGLDEVLLRCGLGVEF
ncbi:MAG: hypothetical protein ABIQ52_03995 [Vicinamibacterales bacterium]